MKDLIVKGSAKAYNNYYRHDIRTEESNSDSMTSKKSTCLS